MAIKQNPEELLPPAAADRGSGVRLTTSEEITIINRPGRSTHPEEKSVLRSEAAPHDPRPGNGLQLEPSLGDHRDIPLGETQLRTIIVGTYYCARYCPADLQLSD